MADNGRWYPQHPMVAVHPLVLKDGQILLVKRLKEPAKGKWGIPGGRIELGETIYETAKREVLEECSVEISIERLLSADDYIIRDEEGRISYHFVLVYMLARYESGDVKAQSNAADARWFASDELAELDSHPRLRAVLTKAGFLQSH